MVPVALREEAEPELSLEFNLPPDPEDFEFGDEPAADRAPGAQTAASWQHAGEERRARRGR